MMTLAERLATVDILRNRRALAAARKLVGPKPWPDHPAPWGDGDSDGEAVTTPPYRDEPGDEISEPPASSPDSDLDLRASLTAAAAACRDQEAARAMLAIEARLGEITLFLSAARLGAAKGLQLKLDVLKIIL